VDSTDIGGRIWADYNFVLLSLEEMKKFYCNNWYFAWKNVLNRLNLKKIIN
jgi:hypothetical protein